MTTVENGTSYIKGDERSLSDFKGSCGSDTGQQETPTFPASSSERSVDTEQPISTFSKEARDELTSKGFIVYTLDRKGKSRDPNPDSLNGEIREMAFDPNYIFLKYSKGKTLEEQARLVENYSNLVTKKIPGAFAVIGTVHEYTKLVEFHTAWQEGGKKENWLNRFRGKKPFGKDYDHAYTRTSTASEVTGESIIFGNSRKKTKGPISTSAEDKGRFKDVLIAPIIVPLRK